MEKNTIYIYIYIYDETRVFSGKSQKYNLSIEVIFVDNTIVSPILGNQVLF